MGMIPSYSCACVVGMAVCLGMVVDIPLPGAQKEIIVYLIVEDTSFISLPITADLINTNHNINVAQTFLSLPLKVLF